MGTLIATACAVSIEIAVCLIPSRSTRPPTQTPMHGDLAPVQWLLAWAEFAERSMSRPPHRVDQEKLIVTVTWTSWPEAIGMGVGTEV
jgi:hypothetical protein